MNQKQKSTSSIRRVDDLGRVVIPKEIREKLCLVEGSSVQVFCDGINAIIRKNDQTQDIIKQIKMCLNAFVDFDVYAFVTSTTKIVASNSCDKTVVAQTLPKSFQEVLFKREQKILHNNLFNPYQKTLTTQCIFPLISKGEICGALVVMTEKFCDNFNFALPVAKILEQMLN